MTRHVYLADQLCALNRDDRPPPRRVRKTIFNRHLWWPKWRHPSRAVFGCGTRRYPRGGGSSTTFAGVRLGLLNARSVLRKSTAICDTVSAEQLDVLAITETWHRTADDLPLKRFAPPGYAIVDAPRCNPSASRGGGVALLSSNRFTAKRLSLAVQPTTFEVVACSLYSATTSAVYVVVYRPTSQAPSESFYEELTQLFEIVAAYCSQVVICGDFNIHVNEPGDRDGQRLNELLASFDLVQTVSGPTHCADNTLDLVITRRDCQPTDCDVQPPGVISDHGLIVCRFASAPFAAKRVITELRSWKKLDLEAFTASLRSSALCDDVSKLRQLTADKMFALYDGTLRSIVDKHVTAYKAAVCEHYLSP